MNDIANQLIAQIIPWMVLAAVISILGPALRVFIWPKLKGWLGEAAINFLIKHHLEPATYHLIPDVMLPTADGTTQIDHVIVSRYGIFVLETKTFKGWIFGDEKSAQRTQQIFRKKSQFMNPLRQNYKHTKTLATLKGIPEDYFKSLIVFVGDCHFKTVMPPNVVYVGGFVPYIKSFGAPMIKDEQVSEIVSAIKEWAGTVTNKQRAGHVAHVQQIKAPVSAEAEAPACPRCSATMTLRKRKADGSRFWGCPEYPACKGIRVVG